MKKPLLLFLSLTLGFHAYSRVYTVNNQIAVNEPGKYLYKSITDAHNAASMGDTLYIQGSAINYNTSTNITKQLTIIGPGYLLDSNGETQFDKLTANVYGLVFTTGSENSKAIGLNFYTGSGGVTINTHYISVIRCIFQLSVDIYIIPNSDGVSIQSPAVQQCMFLWKSGYNTPAISQSLSYAAVKNLLFSNNICERPFQLIPNSSGSLVNNTFLNNSFDVAESSISMTNNILMGTDKTKILLPSNTAQITYNISETDVFGTSNGNRSFATTSGLFVNTGSADGRYQIKTNGPAHLTGLNGTSIGAFGGQEPYRLSGLPPIPAIYQLSTTGFGSQNGSLSITVKAKTN